MPWWRVYPRYVSMAFSPNKEAVRALVEEGANLLAFKTGAECNTFGGTMATTKGHEGGNGFMSHTWFLACL